MKQRLLIAAIWVPILFVAVVFLPKIVFALMTAGISAISAFELMQTTGFVKHPRIRLYTAVLAAAIPVWTYFGAVSIVFSAMITVYAFAVFAEILADFENVRMTRIAPAFFAGLLLPYLLASMVRIMDLEAGRMYIVLAIAVPFMSDAGGYFAGRAFGKHKMTPKLSPHKTVEGLFGCFAGSVFAAVLLGAVYRLAFSMQINFLAAVVYGIAGGGTAVVGDLLFSAFKRQANIKDYGHMLGSHGGMLDRFDSMVAAAPVLELLIAFLPMIGGRL